MACKDFSLREDSHRRNRSAKCAFAPPYVRCQLLEEVDETRQNLHAYLPVLQEYLGHVNISDTEYYLHFSADMTEDIRETLENRLGCMIPTTNKTTMR